MSETIEEVPKPSPDAGSVGLWGFMKTAPLAARLKVMVVLMSGAVVVVSSTWIVSQLLRLQKTGGEIRRPASQNAGEFSVNLSYELKDVALALSKRGHQGRTSYAQFSLVLDLPSKDSKRLMELNRAKILNTIHEVGSRFNLEDFQYPGIYGDFKSALLAQLQKEFGAEAPSALSIREWVIN